MPSQLQTATKRLRMAQTNFVKVHKAAMKRAAGSQPAGRLKKRRKKAAGKKVMGFDVGPGWKKVPISAQRRAATAYQNKKNAAINRASRFRSDMRQAGKRAAYG